MVDAEWSLTPEQLTWMEAHKTPILNLYQHKNGQEAPRNLFDMAIVYERQREVSRSLLDGLIADGYSDVFGNVSWDKAADRYEDYLILYDGIRLDGRRVATS